ncbi:MAG: SPOR domain-containing protein [Bacteroidaceae bacterium]|nr:SPOR domain-containing protein [Bacteroidaceae bacterium]
MKSYFVMGAAICVALSMVSCKSSESAYKKAYEKAQQNQPTTTQVVQQPVQQQPTTVAPVQTVTTTPVATNENTRSENLTLVSGAGLKSFSVVVGSFSIKANAENTQKKLANSGYAAQIAMNPQGMYRVIAATFDSLAAATDSRNTLRAQYPDAWLLRK